MGDAELSASSTCTAQSYSAGTSVCYCEGTGITSGSRRNLNTINSGYHESFELSVTSDIFMIQQDTNYTSALAYQPPPPHFNPYPILVSVLLVLAMTIAAF